MKKFRFRIMFLMIITSMIIIGFNSVYATDYEYDKLNRLVKETYDDGTTVEYIYDEGGNIERVITQKIFDVYADGTVDMLDLIEVAKNYNTANVSSDLNIDGIVNLFDLILIVREI